MQGLRPITRPICLLLASVLLASGSPARTGTLYACEDAGTRVYSDRPCGPDARMLDLPDAPAPSGKRSGRKTGDSAATDEARIAAWAKASQRRLPASLGGAASSTHRGGQTPAPRKAPEADPCADARKALAAAEARGPLDFRQLRQHGDRIWAACSK